jgi:tetratricopeptide (TPR) repeat protein
VDLEEHREAEAARKFERAINLNPDFEPAYADLAVAQLNQNDAQAAVATLTRAHAKFPESYRLSYLTGLAQAHLGKFDAAYAAFQKAEELARDKEPEALDHRFYFQVGAMLERAGREEESVKYLEQSLKLKPDFDEALNHLGYMWAEKGINLERAHAMIEQAVKAEPDNPAYLDSLGWVLFKMNRPADALPWLEKAVKLLPEPDATVYDHLADVLQALGRKDDAREAWRKSLEVEKNEAVQKKLDGLK